MFIYKQYDQQALNDQYNNRMHVPGFAAHLDSWEIRSREAEKAFPVVKDLAYGNEAREKLDVYPSSNKNSKVLIFIHGGYWYKMDKSSFQFIAEAFHEYNVSTFIITYPLAPAAAMDEIVAAARNALAWVYSHCEQFNGDKDQLYVAGYSAGGHLAGMLLTEDWPSNHNLPADVIKGTCVMSGLFNLIPIQLSDINEMLLMNYETAGKNSPATLKSLISSPIVIAVGENETAEFNDQSKELYINWKEKLPADFLLVSHANHFSIIEEFADKQSSLHQAMVKLMAI